MISLVRKFEHGKVGSFSDMHLCLAVRKIPKGGKYKYGKEL